MRTAEMEMQTISAMSSYWPRRLRTPSTWRLLKLAGTTGAWNRWATAAVLNWSPRSEDNAIPVFQIHGDCDRTSPLRYVDADYVVRGGGHVLPLTLGREVAEKLRQIAA